jgi:hypothetical protein
MGFIYLEVERTSKKKKKTKDSTEEIMRRTSRCNKCIHSAIPTIPGIHITSLKIKRILSRIMIIFQQQDLAVVRPSILT